MIEARKFSDGTTENLLKIADQILRLAKKLDPDRPGGYLCVADGESGIPILVQGFGQLHPVKAEEQCLFSQEKASRLATNPSHSSSWQSRNVNNRQFGGAVRGKSKILSWSGRPELHDEAMMLWLAILTGQLDVSAATAIAQISSNQSFVKLGEQVEASTALNFGMSDCGGLTESMR